MNHKIELPEPWEHVETLSPEDQDRLEAVAGSKLTYEDLEDGDVNKDEFGVQPRSRKSWLVMGRRWNRVRNSETREEVLIRLQTFGRQEVEISSVIFPMDRVDPSISGNHLRNFPVAAIAAAYSYDEQDGHANLATFLKLMDEIAEKTDALEPLPPASNSDKFSALVARQYRAIEDERGGEYIAQHMATINDRPLPTVQRWITQARKAGFLAPARTGRRPKND